MNDLTQYGTPPIVKTDDVVVDLYQMDCHELDEVFAQCEKNKSKNLITQAKILCIMEDSNGYTSVGSGYKSLADYFHARTGKSKSTMVALIRVWRKFVEELGCDEDIIENADYNKLSIICSYVDEDNLDQMLKEVEDKNQAQLREMVKTMKGMEPEEHETDNEEKVKLVFEGSKDDWQTIKLAIEEAKEHHSNPDASNFNALEILSAHYLTSQSLSGNINDTLNELFARIEKSHGLEPIKWKRKDNA